MNTEVYVGVTRTDGSVEHLAVQLVGRFPAAPNAFWQPLDDNLWGRLKLFVIGLTGRPKWATFGREPTDQAINYEVMRRDAYWTVMGDPGLVSWRRLSMLEHEMFNQNRGHRNALEDVGGKIQHNMPKARELHREMLRHYNGDKLLGLDREWVNASIAKDNAKVKATEDKRKALADTVSDPRIEAAQTITELLAVTPAEV